MNSFEIYSDGKCKFCGHQVTATSDHSERPADSAAAVATEALLRDAEWALARHEGHDSELRRIWLRVRAALSSSAGDSTPPVQRDAQVDAGIAGLIDECAQLAFTTPDCFGTLADDSHKECALVARRRILALKTRVCAAEAKERI